VIVTGLTAGTLDFSDRVWTRKLADWVQVRSNLAMRIRDGLAEAGIQVPLPQRELLVRNAPGAPAAVAPGPGDADPAST
jgi:small-conductance mechanosensitive channel